jgi:TRAP-type C4-dicarboxylate transport system permease small subunit
MLHRLGKIHDTVTTIGFAGGAACVGMIVVAFWYEVTARYFFNAPTMWSHEVAAYLLCPLVFLSVPAMAQRAAHISISFLMDSTPARYRLPIAKAVLLGGGSICLFAAWITGAETWRQYLRGVETIAAIPIPKWWVSIFIPYGMLSSGLHFLRQFAGAPAHQTGKEVRS